jgi:hypothetical protein
MTSRRQGVSPVSSESGQVLVSVALLSVVLVGFLGFALDGGYLYLVKRRAQSAADAGAYAGALELWHGRRGRDPITDAAHRDAELNDFPHGVAGIDVHVNWPPTAGNWAGNMDFVEVIITQPHNPFLMDVVGFGNSPIRARAVAGLVGGPVPCIQTLGTGGTGISMSGSATVNAPGCAVTVNSPSNSAINLSGSASLSAGSVDVVGEAATSGSASITPTPTEHAPPTPDPFSGLVFPSFPSSPCINGTRSGSGSHTFSPGVYCNITLSGSVNVTFQPGEYRVNTGGVSISGSNVIVNGGGVTFFNKGNFNISGTVQGTLAAPTTGPWSGMLFVQDPGMLGPPSSALSGSLNLVLEGVIYMPRANLSWSGFSNASADYTVVIVSTITLSGNVTFNNNWTALPGGGPVVKPKLVE